MTALVLLPDNAGANTDARKLQRHRFTSNTAPGAIKEEVRVCNKQLTPDVSG